MLTIRCTRRLLARLKVTATDPAPASTTRLGDWYAYTLVVHRRPVILFVSAPTLLPVLVPQRELRSLVPRFQEALRRVLLSLGVPDAIAALESDGGWPVVFARTESRRVLGAMTEFASHTRWESEVHPARDLLTLSLALAGMPCGPIAYRHPARAMAERLHLPHPVARR